MQVNKCRIYDEDNRACYAHYKSLSEKRLKDWYHGKPYSSQADKGNHRASDKKRPNGGETHVSIKSFKCGELGHRDN